MKILVTGGTGYIGSHTCVELMWNNHDIVIVDDLSNSKIEVIDYIREITGSRPLFYQIDLKDFESVQKVFEENEIDAVIHFAGFKAVGESVQKPLEYYENNLVSTLNLCKAMKEVDCKRLVFSSSATVYGTSQNVPFQENLPTSATNPYGWTKVMIEQILRDLVVADPQWSISLLRYFNPIGAHPSGLLGELPNGIPNNLVPYIAKVAVGELPYLRVYGDDYPTPDGTGVRDYLHVVDLAKGHVKALEYVSEHNGTHTFNLGTGIGYSVLDVLHAYEKACEKILPYQIEPRRSGDIAVSYADPTQAREVLGWQAEFSLAQMCEDSWRFTKMNLD